MVRSVSSAARASDAASLKSERIEKDTTAPAEQHCLVDSDDEGLLSAEDLEWALAQRSTDPFIKQRLQKGNFMFVKVAGCEGFHCYETELLDRLQALGMDLAGPLKAQAATEARAAAEAEAAAAAAVAAAATGSSPGKSGVDTQLAQGNSSQHRASRRHKQAPGSMQDCGSAPHDGDTIEQQQQQQEGQMQQQPNSKGQKQHNQRQQQQQQQQQRLDGHLQQAPGKQQQQGAAAPTFPAEQQRRQRQRWGAQGSSNELSEPAAEPAVHMRHSGSSKTHKTTAQRAAAEA